MDYRDYIIIALGILLAISVIRNFLLEKKIERMMDADIIDDITPMEDDDEEGECIILYL